MNETEKLKLHNFISLKFEDGLPFLSCCLFLWPCVQFLPVLLVVWPFCIRFCGLVYGSRVFAMPWGKIVHVHRIVLPLVTRLDTSRLLGRVAFRLQPGWWWSSCIFVSCKLSLVTIRITQGYLFSLSPGSSIWRELTRLGTRAWKGLRLLLFLPVGSGEGPDWNLRSDASRNPAGDG